MRGELPMVFAPAGINMILEVGAVVFMAPKIAEAVETASKIVEVSKNNETSKEEEKK